MTDLESVLRDTLHDDDLAPMPSPDIAYRARRLAERQGRTRQAAAVGLTAVVVAVAALGAARLAQDGGAAPAQQTAPSSSPAPNCADLAGASNSPTADTDRLRVETEQVLPPEWKVFGLRALPPCDDPGAPTTAYTRTAVLSRVVCTIPPATGRHQVLTVSRTTYDPSPTKEQLLANADRPTLLERTNPDGSFVVVYLRADPAQGVRVAAAVAPNGVTVTVEVPPEGNPLAYGLSVDAAADLAETLLRDGR
jgi:hypothetical protein